MQPFAHAEHSFRDACLNDNPDHVRWMAFIDADEFLFPSMRLNLVSMLGFDTSHEFVVPTRNNAYLTTCKFTPPRLLAMLTLRNKHDSSVIKCDTNCC